MHPVYDDFTQTLHERWTQTCMGPASLTIADSSLRMALAPTPQGTYADAQIDDYSKLRRASFPWRPPLRMEIRARSSRPVGACPSAFPLDPLGFGGYTFPGARPLESGSFLDPLEGTATSDNPDQSNGILRGTAGFGFWNYPFSARGDILMLPEAIWFFYASPPSNMALVPDVRGWGWKAQVVHSIRLGALLAILPTAITTAWGLITHNSRSAARWLQRLSGTSETLLSTEFTAWHTYTLEWHPTEAIFCVDDTEVLRVPHPPTRPLGFVAWLDNQYAVATPQGVFRFGTVACDAQWVEMDRVNILPL